MSPLAGLTNLKELYLPASSLSDLGPLASLTGLERLALRDGEAHTSGVTDLSPLAGFTQMQDLYLMVGTLDSLDFLSGMSELESLRIHTAGDSSVQDLSPLSGLTSLKRLELPATAGDGCIDLSPIAGLTSLEDFQFGCNIPSLEPLRGMRNLTTLVLNDQPGRAEVQFLTLHTPAVTDLSPLAGLDGLVNLSVDGENIADWSPVEHVPNVNRG